MQFSAQTTSTDSGLFFGHPDSRGRHQKPNGRRRRKSVRRLHLSSQPKRLFSEAVDDEPCLTLQNPADVVGETVFDCRPSVLPVSIPLLGLGPGMMAEARPTGKSIMDMDTNEITIWKMKGRQRSRHRSRSSQIRSAVVTILILT